MLPLASDVFQLNVMHCVGNAMEYGNAWNSILISLTNWLISISETKATIYGMSN